MPTATSVASVQTLAITVRRSTRSDTLPTGYWVSTAARMLTAMNAATPRVPEPLRRAYTGPIENRMEEIIPDTATATTPSGELRYTSRQRTGCGTAGPGGCCAEATIGTIATQRRHATSMQ